LEDFQRYFQRYSGMKPLRKFVRGDKVEGWNHGELLADRQLRLKSSMCESKSVEMASAC
jgi:hypothetical protein